MDLLTKMQETRWRPAKSNEVFILKVGVPHPRLLTYTVAVL